MYNAKILLDSVSPSGNRLTTFEIVFPRFILAQLNKHTVLSSNAASSRAIPTWKLITQVIETPVIPIMGKNNSGMSSKADLTEEEVTEATLLWKNSAYEAARNAYELADRSVAPKNFKEIKDKLNRLGYLCKDNTIKGHKQWVNRILEPYLWQTVVISGTEWSNFFSLRVDHDSQPEFQKIAKLMLAEYNAGKPTKLKHGEWHLPFIQEDERKLYPIEQLVRISSARCARVSYLTHNGIRDVSEDLRLFSNLHNEGHMSPMQHPAKARENSDFVGNYRGFIPFRKLLPGENITTFPKL